MKNIAIGIDIGGTSFKGAAITSNGEVKDVFRFDVDKSKTQEELIHQLVDELNKYLDDHGYNKDNILGVGVGIPGTIDVNNGEVIYSNNLRWKNLPIKKLIEDGTGLEVRIINDANAATLGEAMFGAGKKYKNIVLLTLGTGVGSGIIINGEIYEGTNGFGCELGHMVIKYDGEECTCGRKGCLEAYASATALARDTRRMIKLHPESKMNEIAKQRGKIGAHVAFIAAKQGDKYAQELIDNYVMYLGEGILDICNIFRPEAIVLSGGIANEGEYLTSRLIKYCSERDYGFHGSPKVEIMTSLLGYDSGKIGAASLFFKKD